MPLRRDVIKEAREVPYLSSSSRARSDSPSLFLLSGEVGVHTLDNRYLYIAAMSV